MIKIGIVGYGNLAKGAECAIAQNEDMTLSAVFTRRDPKTVTVKTPNVPVCHLSDLPGWKGKLDVLLLCGGSATDLPEQTAALAKDFTVVDSFDNHSQIPAHFARVDEAAKAGGHLAVISTGWDPGLFSLNRLYANAVLPEGKDYTFWGRGVSQGHSDAVRRIDGVQDARQYTIPVESALQSVRAGENPTLTTRQKHTRYCYVVAKEGANKALIEKTIQGMPAYFADYDTTVEFISQEEMDKHHAGLPHGGHVIRTGKTGWEKENTQTIEYTLKLQSNPQFTASVLICCARAAHRMALRGEIGCKTIFDIAPSDLISIPRETLLKQML